MEQRQTIPGTKQFKQQIYELKSELRAIDDQIRDYERKIDDIKKTDAKNSPKAPLLNKKKEIITLIKELNGNRKHFYDKMNIIKETYGDLSNKQNENKGFMSTEAIDKRLKEINIQMLKYPCTAQEAKTFEDEIKDLKNKKTQVELEKKKYESIKLAQEEFYNLKSSIREVNSSLSEKNDELTKINKELKELESKEEEKNPAIESLEKSISNLKIKKGEINKKIEINQEEIAKKKEEYAIYQQKKAIQDAYEKRRNEINEKIKKLEADKEDKNIEKQSCDSAKFDAVILALERIKGNENEQLVLPFDIVLSLTKFKANIPSRTSQIEEIVETLRKKKNEFLKNVAIKIKELDDEIMKLQEVIDNEKKLLAEIPVVEERLPPFFIKEKRNK